MAVKRASSRKAKERRDIALIVGMVVAIIVLGGWVGYSYYTYRTFSGNPNIYPVFVSARGKVISSGFYSQALKRRMHYQIYLPPGYAAPQNVGVRYPVVYLLHGAPGAYGDWFTIGGADVRMDTLLARKQVRPMILVSAQGSPSRFARSTEYVNGPMGRWATYITRDLVRQIDSHYRTVAARRGRAIAGLSEGAYAAVNLALKHPGEYAVAGSFSGYFTEPANQPAFRGNAHLAAANSPARCLPALKGRLPKLFLYVGYRERVNAPQNLAFNRELTAKGVPHEFHIYPGGHYWSFWRTHLAGFLAYAGSNLRGG